ncbi:MAG: DedA family protein [Actinomycetota bacterium]|nr:DedA family protein [Actinomycetota bacterium]
MSGLREFILRLDGLPALAVVFTLPALEASVFIGFLVPGEIAVVLGGVLAFEHRVALPAAIAAAVLGAIVGDAVGYLVGRRYGERLLRRLPRWLIRDDHIAKAKDALNRLGGKAVFLGRFTAALRAMVPGLAGMAGMPFRTFAIYNVAGGVVWATSFVLLGYVAGDGWRRLESRLQLGGYALFGLVVLALAAVLLVRRVRRRRAQRSEAPSGP